MIRNPESWQVDVRSSKVNVVNLKIFLREIVLSIKLDKASCYSYESTEEPVIGFVKFISIFVAPDSRWTWRIPEHYCLSARGVFLLTLIVQSLSFISWKSRWHSERFPGTKKLIVKFSFNTCHKISPVSVVFSNWIWRWPIVKTSLDNLPEQLGNHQSSENTQEAIFILLTTDIAAAKKSPDNSNQATRNWWIIRSFYRREQRHWTTKARRWKSFIDNISL